MDTTHLDIHVLQPTKFLWLLLASDKLISVYKIWRPFTCPPLRASLQSCSCRKLSGNSREGSYLWSIDASVGQGGRLTPFPARVITAQVRCETTPIMPILIPLHHHLAAAIILVGPTSTIVETSSICVWWGGHQSGKETTILCLKPSSISNLHALVKNLP